MEHSAEGAAKAALKAMLDDDSELVTIYYGCDVKEEDAEKLKEAGRRVYSRIRKWNFSMADSLSTII